MTETDTTDTPDRELVDEQTLRGLINKALSEHADTAGVEVVGKIKPADEPYDDGGNWKRSIAIGGKPSDPQKCGETAADLIEEIAESYNLAASD